MLPGVNCVCFNMFGRTDFNIDKEGIIMEAYVASHLKDMNRRRVYKLLCELEETSKSEISRLTGISAPTVIKIINFFSEQGLLEELGGGESALGRKPQMLRINKNKFYAIGVIHEGDYLKVGITNLMNEIICLKKVKLQDNFTAVMGPVLFGLINEALVESEVRASDLLGIGIGIPAIYDIEHKSIAPAPLIGVTETLCIAPIIDKISQKYNLPVYVDNDLNMEVQGEFISKKLGTDNDLIYLSVGTGIGSGVILNGSIRRGRRYMCGEVGYTAFLDDYVADKATAGWLESKVNLSTIIDHFGDPETGEIDERGRNMAVEYVSICLSLCINNMILCYDPDHFSVGGELFDLLGKQLFEATLEKLRRISADTPPITMKSCAEPGVIGASSVAIHKAMRRILEE